MKIHRPGPLVTTQVREEIARSWKIFSPHRDSECVIGQHYVRAFAPVPWFYMHGIVRSFSERNLFDLGSIGEAKRIDRSSHCFSSYNILNHHDQELPSRITTCCILNSRRSSQDRWNFTRLTGSFWVKGPRPPEGHQSYGFRRPGLKISVRPGSVGLPDLGPPESIPGVPVKLMNFFWGVFIDWRNRWFWLVSIMKEKLAMWELLHLGIFSLE